VLKDLGTAGWIGAFIYCVATGIRLARFNTNIGIVDKRYFQGLPCPSAAAVLAGLIWVLVDFGFKPDQWYVIAGITWFVSVFMGMTMVSNVPFYSFKDISFKRSVPFIVIVAIALGIAVINIHPPTVLFTLFCLYGFSGYGVYVWRRMKGRPVSVIATSTDEPDEEGLHR
jgi:CDP-diacylglycerol--serine O-phosphatidyltransferase